MFYQTFEPHDLAIVALLVVLEGVLSIDNALVLGLLAKRLPHELQKKALTYGLVGAFAFRLIAILTASWLLHWRIVKLLGGAYLIYVALKHFLIDSRQHTGPHTGTLQDKIARGGKFWPTVMVIELTDIAFAVDSIVAAIGVVGAAPHGAPRHPKLWVVVLGGCIGVILMRYAAVIFIKLLERFPRFETAAYLLVTIIGGKLTADWAFNNPPADWPVGETFHGPLDFHSLHSPAFWVFWALMLGCFCIGFIPSKSQQQVTPPPGLV